MVGTRWTTLILVLATLAAIVSACQPSPSTSATIAVDSHPQIAVHVASARIQSGKMASVSASCAPGEQMLGGGFSASNFFEYAAYIDASYPSSATTWTVEVSAPASFFDVEVEVYCLPATPPMRIQIAQASAASLRQAVCPPGTVLLSGGWHSTQPVGVSHPQSKEWITSSSGDGAQAYALCAPSHVLPGELVASAFSPHSSTHSYAPGTATVACPNGQITMGGGFEGEGLIVGSHAITPAFTGWSVSAGGDGDVMLSAMCWTLQG